MSGINGILPENPADPSPSPAASLPSSPAASLSASPSVPGDTNGVDFGHFEHWIQENQMDARILRNCLIDLEDANEEGFPYWAEDQLRGYVADLDDQSYESLLPVVGTLVTQALATHVGGSVTLVSAHSLGEGTVDSPVRIIFQVVCENMRLNVADELIGRSNVVYTTDFIELGTCIVIGR